MGQKKTEQQSPSEVSSSCEKLQSGIEKLKSLFKTNFGVGEGAAPKKRVSFEIPDDIKQLYQDDPEVESYVVVEIEKQKQEHEEHLAKVAAERKSCALNITIQWLQKLEAEEKQKQIEEQECVKREKEEQEKKKCEEEKRKKKEDEIREKVLALKKQKEEEDARKEAECKSKLEDFELENKIHAEQNMELLPIPPELIDRAVPQILKKPQEIKKEKFVNNSVTSEQNSGSNSVSATPNSSGLTVGESVKRRILPDGGTPPKKHKKESSSVSSSKEFAALLLSPSKYKTRSSKHQPPQMDSQEKYKMFCKQKQKMMSQADGFLNVEHGETECDALLVHLFEHCYELDRDKLLDAKKDSFFQILKYSFEDLTCVNENEAVEKMRWRLSTFVGDNLSTWSNVSFNWSNTW